MNKIRSIFIFTGCLSIFLLLCTLGVWQLHRASEKREWLNLNQAHLKEEPVSILDLNDRKRLNYVPVKLTGHYEKYPIIFLDNKVYQHQIGYQVLVPFVPEQGTKRVWVNKGWVQRGKSRNDLPKVNIPEGKISLEGMIHIPETSGFRLGKNLELLSSKLWRLQRLELDSLHPFLNQPFYPFEILLVNDHMGDKNVWVRNWEPKVSVTPERHLGYAIQWFALAIVFCVVFIVCCARKKT